jgi:acyl-CoA thioesterase I
MEPFWRGDVLRDESCLFVRRGDRPPMARLLLPSQEILAVTDASGETRYGEGEDWALGEDGRTMTLPEGSGIPHLAETALYPPLSLQGAIPYRVGGDRWLLFSEDVFFAEQQVRVTYRHGGWEGPVPTNPGLRRTLDRLEDGALTMVLFGDSISAGANATQMFGVPPNQPPYGSLVAERLRQAYGAEVAYTNLSVGGMDSGWGLRQIGAVVKLDPDLVILGWGMNDSSGGRSVEGFIANVRGQMDAVLEARPECDIVLVATMWGNPEWALARPDLYPVYRDALEALVAPGVALADMTTLWGWMLQRKRFVDLTGNGVNHPNDFGHGMYADTVMAAIVGTHAL